MRKEFIQVQRLYYAGKNVLSEIAENRRKQTHPVAAAVAAHDLVTTAVSHPTRGKRQ